MKEQHQLKREKKVKKETMLLLGDFADQKKEQ